MGLVYAPIPPLRLSASYARGFRQFAPNFGVRQLGFGVLVPNELLDPVTADNYEAAVKWRLPGFRGSLAGYYTDFDNFQNIVAGIFEGEEFFDIEGDGIEPDDKVFVATGNGDAFVYGVEIEAELDLHAVLPALFGPQWTVGGGRFLGGLDTALTGAPLLGILGTVLGIMQTFQAIDQAGAIDPRGVSGGIGKALVTTAAGLVVALVALLSEDLLRGRARLALDEMEREGSRLETLLEGRS